MSKKYDFALEMESRNSLSLIINRIENGSRVLEFGPAFGRMTKFLKEEKSCSVSIVELDEEAFNSSISYAENGLCGNIEELEWLKIFANEKFDYVVFADVLEHLYNPKFVLEKVSELLKEDGSILVSIPNVAHNTVLVNLYNNIFKYTEVGLLDNTHIRFFTMNTLLDMIYSASYIPVYEDAVYLDVGETEIDNKYTDLPLVLQSSFKKRPYGHVYQFIMELKKKKYYDENNTSIDIVKKIINNRYRIKVKIYIDHGNGFDESQVIIKHIDANTKEGFIDLSEYEEFDKIRIDILESSSVVVLNKLFACIDGGNIPLNIDVSNAVYNFGDNYIFNGEFPQFIIEIPTTNIVSGITYSIGVVNFCNEGVSIIDNIANNYEYKLKKIERELRENFNKIHELSNENNRLIIIDEMKQELEVRLENELQIRHKMEERLENESQTRQETAERLENELQIRQEIEERLENVLQLRQEIEERLENELRSKQDLRERLIVIEKKNSNYIKRLELDELTISKIEHEQLEEHTKLEKIIATFKEEIEQLKMNNSNIFNENLLLKDNLKLKNNEIQNYESSIWFKIGKILGWKNDKESKL